MISRRVHARCWACLTVLAGWGLVHGAQLQFTVLDEETDQPVPCRIHLKDAAGKPVQAKGLPFWHDHFVCSGRATVDATRSEYSYEIDRGPEYLMVTGKVAVAETKMQSVTNRLARLTTLFNEGWWPGETHVHRRPEDIELLMEAEDLHVAPVITWWNDQNLWRNRPVPADPLVRFDGNRFYYLMGGEDERAGGALLFFKLRQPLEISGAGREYPSPMKFLTEAHQKGAWIEVEKPFWYDVPVWLASGMVDSIGIAHNHMQRSGVYPGEAWGRPRDKQRLPDPQGNGLWTQEIYYHALNCGLRIPPTAGSASGVLPNPVGYDRVYVHVDGDLTYTKWWEGLKAGRVFVSNGPLLRCRANGEWPGHVFKADREQTLSVSLEAKLDSRDPVSAVEIIQNGRVMRTVQVSEWKRTGSLGEVTFQESGWFLVRAIADVPSTFRFASTGPFYVEVGPVSRRVSRASARFFLDWVRERSSQIRVSDPSQNEEVMRYHREAERFWQQMVAQATAE
jgi:hypothetical protein